MFLIPFRSIIFVVTRQRAMATNFFLANKSKEKSSIDVIVRFKNERFKRAAGVSVETIYWNDGWCREVMEYPRGKSINKLLKKIQSACNRVCDDFEVNMEIPAEKEFWKQVDLVMTGCVKKKLSFVEHMESYVEDLKKIMKRNSVKPFESALGLLQKYEGERGVKLNFKDIDLEFYNDFKAFMSESNYTESYFGAIIKKIKKTYVDAKDIYKLHNLDGVKKFKVPTCPADTIALDEEEILKIYTLKITPDIVREFFPGLSDYEVREKMQSCIVARNKFLAGYCTALRISDVQKMTDININKNEVKIFTTKTEKPVIIPLHWILREILKNGFDLAAKMSDQKINDRIKDVCRMAGIDQIIQITRKEITKTITVNIPKYDAVTTHTARRSGATNMYRSGIPTLSCMKITGHKTEREFFNYIKIDEEENARILASHSFFNKKEAINDNVDDKIEALQAELNLSPEELIKKLIESVAKKMVNK